MQKKILLIIIFLVFLLVILLNKDLVKFYFGINDYDLDFELKEWQTNIEIRPRMVDDLLDKEILIGKSKNEVAELMSAYQNINPNDSIITFSIGGIPHGMGIEFVAVKILFKNDSAINVQKISIID